jgi:VanZ family protein
MTWVAIALIVYASLHPWSGWRWPDSQVFSWVLPKLGTESLNDMVANVLGYLPLGLIWCLAHLRSQRHPAAAAVLTVLGGSALSYSMELIQNTLPARVPSMMDWVLNTLGTAWGALAALTVHALGLVDAWHRLRERWFIPQAGHGLALLWVWPIGLLFPPPLPLGEGQLFPHLRIALMEWTQDTPFQQWILPSDPLTLWATVHSAVDQSRWLPWVEASTVAAGLLAPMCVACAVARPRSFRVALLLSVVLLAVGVTMFSAALNFGPVHALTWVTIPSLFGLVMGSAGGTLLVNRSRTTCAALGVVVVLTLIGLIHLAPPDPYYAQTLQSWENGRFIRFHGLSRWFGILWPYVALLWLLGRLLGKDHQGLDGHA